MPRGACPRAICAVENLSATPGATGSRAAENIELYCKPDDRWEVNDVANRCPDVVEGLQQALSQSEQAAVSGQVASLPPLEEWLAAGD